MRGPRFIAPVVVGGLALLGSTPTESWMSQHFEPALHVEFDSVPDELLSVVRAHSSSSHSQKICKVAVDRLQGSSSSFLREVAKILAGKNATLEPSFGCGMLGLAGTQDSRARFWTVRARVPSILPWRFVKRVQTRLEGTSGVKTVAPVPRAIPAQANACQPVTSPTADWPPDGVDPYVGYSEYSEPDWAPKGTQWYLHACGVLDAWRVAWPPSDPATAPVIAVVDFGFWIDHPELQTVLKKDRARNTCDESMTVNWGSEIDHGTATAGLVAAAYDGHGIMGVAYGAEVWPLQGVCENPASDEDSADEESSGDPWAKAVDWVTEADSQGRRKIVVLTMQTSDRRNYESNLAFRHAVARAADRNVVVILAAGNGGKDVATDIKEDFIPETKAILVGATSRDPAATRCVDSNWGTRVVVSAPGDESADVALSADPSNPYRREFGGTSGAAPKVAGVVAMMLNVNSELTPAQVKDILGRVGDKAASEANKPVGRFLDACAAVNEATALREH